LDNLVRIPTGVRGLDDLVEGGFPYPAVILVAGSAGTGKTTMALQFLSKGAENGEVGLYFTTLSEPTQWMLRFASRFQFLRKEDFGKLIHYVDMGHMVRRASAEDLISFIDDKIAQYMPQRVVIDPITVVGNFLGEEYRAFLYDLTTDLKNWQATTVLTGEVAPGQMYPPEVAYAADGIILLMMEEESDARRKYLEVLKMRGTNHVTGKLPIAITLEEGIVVLKASF